jgi:hypothetical protein
MQRARKKNHQFFFLCADYKMPDFPQFFLHAYKDSPVIQKVYDAGAVPTALITRNHTVRIVPSIHLFPNTKAVYEGEDGIQKFLDMHTPRPMAQKRVAETKEAPAKAPPAPKEPAKPKPPPIHTKVVSKPKPPPPVKVKEEKKEPQIKDPKMDMVKPKPVRKPRASKKE